MEKRTLIGVAAAGGKVRREAQRGDPPDTGRVARIAKIAILLQAISSLQVFRLLVATVIGHIGEAKSLRVSIGAEVEWVLVRVPARLQLTWAGERRVVVEEIAIWVPRTEIGEARAIGGKWRIGVQVGEEEMAIEGMSGRGGREGESVGGEVKIPGWATEMGRGVGGGCSLSVTELIGDDLGTKSPCFTLTRYQRGGIENFFCVFI